MRIILTIDFSPWSAYSGGAQCSTHNLALALARRGHEVAVVYTKPLWERVAVPAGLSYAVHWAVFCDVRSRRKAPLRPLNAFTVARVVGGLLRQHGAAVVHSNGEEGGMLDRLRARYRFGFVATPRHPYYPQELLRAEPLERHEKLWLALTEGKYVMQGRAARAADLVAPPSTFAAGLVQRAFRLDPARLHVVPNGVPEEFLAPRPAVPRTGPLVFFGRFDATKGIDTLIDALAHLGAEAPRTVLIGRGPEKRRIQQQIARLGLDATVTIRPWMTHDALATVLAEAQMVVLPSRVESFGMAVLSALAAGVPVVSTRAGAIPELVQHEVTGLLVAPDDPAALAAALTRLQKDPARARRLGAAGQQHALTHFTWERAAERFETLYESLPAVQAMATHPA